MDKNEKLRVKLAEILEVDSNIIEHSFKINDSTLDSLGILTLLSAIDQIYGTPISGQEIINSNNFGNLVSIIEAKGN